MKRTKFPSSVPLGKRHSRQTEKTQRTGCVRSHAANQLKTITMDQQLSGDSCNSITQTRGKSPDRHQCKDPTARVSPFPRCPSCAPRLPRSQAEGKVADLGTLAMPTQLGGSSPGCEVQLQLSSPTGTVARGQGARVTPGEGQRDAAGPHDSFPTEETNKTTELASLFRQSLLSNTAVLHPSPLDSTALPKLG